MKPTSTLDELMAAALHGDLTPEERAQLETQLQNDPAARAAFQEIQAMHDMLERHHRRPDPAFEERMVSGVRRRIQGEGKAESAWESVVVLWRGMRAVIRNPVAISACVGVIIVALVVVGGGGQTHQIFSTLSNRMEGPAGQAVADGSEQKDLKKVIEKQGINYVETAQKGITMSGYVDTGSTYPFAGKGQNGFPAAAAPPTVIAKLPALASRFDYKNRDIVDGPAVASANAQRLPGMSYSSGIAVTPPLPQINVTSAPVMAPTTPMPVAQVPSVFPVGQTEKTPQESQARRTLEDTLDASATPDVTGSAAGVDSGAKKLPSPASTHMAPAAPAMPASTPSTLKLIRNAQLDLEVKEYQPASDAITALVKEGGGYVDTSNSQKGGNGKLQGTMVVKLLPEDLDGFLAKLRALGTVQNQSVSTEDVTKEYVDLQARMDNSRKMEAQLQELLKRDTNKIADLLKVEDELGRVRGEIEQDQGQLKLWDFQVQLATVTIALREKDLNQTAAYLLKESDNMALYAGDVESVFRQARQAAEDGKAEILEASVNRESPSNVTAEIYAAVPPEQIDAFLAKVRALGRVASFVRHTERVAQDGGEGSDPADQTRTEKDKVLIRVTIQPDDAARKQVTMTVVAPAVDMAFDAAKSALEQAKAEVLGSSLNKAQEGQSTAQLTVRVPGKNYESLLAAFKGLGRTASFQLQRQDDSGPEVAEDDAPVIITLNLTDDDTPLQNTTLTVRGENVDDQAQALKKDAGASGVAVEASDFSREPSGVETAQMTFRLTMAKYPAFLEKLKALGKVETLTVERHDRPDQTGPDGDLPVEVALTLHSRGDVVPDDGGLWITFCDSFRMVLNSFIGSVRLIGVTLAFYGPWAMVLGVLAWVARRIYVRRKITRSATAA